MTASIQDILGYVYLSGLVEDVKTGIPNVLPPAFFSTKGEALADQGRYVRYAGTRRTSKRVEYGGPSRKRELQPIGVFDVKLLHTFEHQDLDVKTYQALRQFAAYAPMAPGAREEVDRQALLFRQLIDNHVVASVLSMLSLGAIYYDSDGNLLPSSSGAQLTVDYGVSANNKNQLNGIIAASWATATTDISAHLRALKLRARQLTGYPLKYAFYGKDVPTYLISNNFVKDWLIRNPAMQSAWLTNPEVPDGLFGLTWVPVYESFYEDYTGTNQAFFGPDTIVFTPEIDKSVYEMLEGTYPVPTSFGPMASSPEAVGSFDVKRGMFSYATALQDPMTARLYGGNTWLPVWKVPDAIFIADIVP